VVLRFYMSNRGISIRAWNQNAKPGPFPANRRDVHGVSRGAR